MAAHDRRCPNHADMNKPTITGAVGIDGQVFRAGQEAELAEAARAAGVDLTADRFKESVRGFAAPEPETDQDDEAEGGNTGGFGADFPGLSDLVGVKNADGSPRFTRPEDLDGLDRKALMKLDGIGEAKADAILAERAQRLGTA